MSRHARLSCVATLASIATVTALCAGCGSSGDKSTGSNDSSPLVDTAKQAISQNAGVPAFGKPGPAINTASLRGKRVLVVAHDQVSDELVGIANGIKAAGKAAGVSVQIFNGDASVSTIQQGLNQGVRERVGAIIIDGIETELVASSILEAKNAGIPVVAVENSEPDANSPGQGAGANIYANAEPPSVLLGKLAADKAIADSGGHADVAIMTFNNPIADAVVKGMKDELAKCSDCKIEATSTIEPGNWPTQVSPQVQSVAKSKPNLDHVLVAADTMGIFATSGLKLAGKLKKVHVLGVDGSSPATLALVKDGAVMQVDPGSSPAWLGWAALDQALRGMLKLKPADPTAPYRWIDTDGLSKADTKNLDAVYGTSYDSGYRHLWGING
jgi:ribose transport system substrate-binding protein